MSLICIAIVAMFVASDAARKNPSLFTSVSERGSKTDKCTGKKKQKKRRMQLICLHIVTHMSTAKKTHVI